MKRRTFIKSTLSTGAAAAAIQAGLLVPSRAFAEWNSAAFAEKELNGALKAIFGISEIENSDLIQLKAPAIAENGAVTNITIDTTLPNVESIAIIASKNPTPLVCQFNFHANALPHVSTRIKLGQTMDVIAVVKSDGKLYQTAKQVEVTLGGCA